MYYIYIHYIYYIYIFFFTIYIYIYIHTYIYTYTISMYIHIPMKMDTHDHPPVETMYHGAGFFSTELGCHSAQDPLQGQDYSNPKTDGLVKYGTLW